MLRASTFVLVSIITVCGLGCAMCCGPDMYTYPTQGGRVQRSDLEYGRVGSPFSDPVNGEMVSEVQMEPSPPPAEDMSEPAPVARLKAPKAEPQTSPARNDARRARPADGWR